MNTPYDKLDKELKKLEPVIIALLNNLRLRVMSTRNNQSIKAQVEKAFSDIDSKARELFLNIAGEYYSVTPRDIDEWLEEYYEVTQYVYKNEWERKAGRYFEVLLTFKNSERSLSSAEAMSAQQRAANLIASQIDEYGVLVVDKARLKNFTENGIGRLRWNTQTNKRVCEICRARNGKIYNIDSAPGKAHYGCRCYYSEVQ